MVVIRSNVMYQCQAFYIGNAAPESGKKGVEAIQTSLRERYVDEALLIWTKNNFNQN